MCSLWLLFLQLVLTCTVCCNGVGVQGTVLWGRIHRRSVRSCAKKVGCLVRGSDQCYPSCFRTHYRRQKRWWSAYLLFFDRLDQEKVFDGEVMLTSPLSLFEFLFKLTESMQKMCPVPQPIQVMVQKQNLEFHHTKSHFSYPYFQFMKQLLTINYNYIRMQVEQSSLTNTAVSP